MVSAILLAAGTSSRMGLKNKLLLPFDGETVLRTVAEKILASGINEVIVVTGYEAEGIRTALADLPVSFVHNANFAAGMTSSIQSGISVANGEGYMICPGDLPLLAAADFRKMDAFFSEMRKKDLAAICVPEYEGQQGHPVIFSAHYHSALLQHAETEGCRGILKAHLKNIYKLPFSHPAILRDMDTPQAYQQLLTKQAGMKI